MRTVLFTLLAATAFATPALAQMAPINFDITVDEKGRLIATPVIQVLPIKFDLAKVSTTESASEPQPQGSGELPASTEQEAKADTLITGGGSIDLRYGFSDRYIQIDSPTANAYASVNLRDLGLSHITADIFAAHGLKTKRNRELDLGLTLHDIPLAEGVTAEMSVSEYFLADLHDITTFVAKVSSGQFDASVTQYLVHNEPDATKLEVGYTLTPIKALALRPLAVFERGFGLPDEFVGGLEASLALGAGFSLSGAVYAAPFEKKGDPRGTVVNMGISFSF